MNTIKTGDTQDFLDSDWLTIDELEEKKGARRSPLDFLSSAALHPWPSDPDGWGLEMRASR